MSSYVVTEKIWELLEGDIYEVGTFESREIKDYGLQKVFVNGNWIGFIQLHKLKRAAETLRQYRRDNHEEWKFITVYISD